MTSEGPVVYALCLARGGSKGIPGKNIRPIGGKPLLCWCMDAALESKVFSRVFVSTDSAEIAQISTGAGYEVHDRDPATATDGASSESGIVDFMNAHPECDVCCLLQATSPMTAASHLVEAYEQFTASGADSLVTVVQTHRFLWKVDKAGVASPVNYNPVQRPRRQDWNGELMENGAFYFFTRPSFEASGSRLSGKITAYEMPAETFTEIDEPEDLLICEKFLAKRNAASAD
jgi:CMP-N-acetylneuraminic acid synthetase